MDLGLAGRVALVMGGSRGLGLACATALASEGCAVAVAARHEDSLRKAAATLLDAGAPKATWHVADAGSAEDLRALVDAVGAAHGRIDVLVTNSGGPKAGGFADVAEGDWEAAFDLVVRQVVRLVGLVTPGMKERKWGRIVNIVSSSYREPIEGLVLSNAFRPAVVGLAKTLAAELGPYGITVNNVAPGRFDTDRLRHLADVRAQKRGGTQKDWMERFARDSPLGRVGDPMELGRAVAFLAGQTGAFVTGFTWPIDGGLLRST